MKINGLNLSCQARVSPAKDSPSSSFVPPNAAQKSPSSIRPPERNSAIYPPNSYDETIDSNTDNVNYFHDNNSPNTELPPDNPISPNSIPYTKISQSSSGLRTVPNSCASSRLASNSSNLAGSSNLASSSAASRSASSIPTLRGNSSPLSPTNPSKSFIGIPTSNNPSNRLSQPTNIRTAPNYSSGKSINGASNLQLNSKGNGKFQPPISNINGSNRPLSAISSNASNGRLISNGTSGSKLVAPANTGLKTPSSTNGLTANRARKPIPSVAVQDKMNYTYRREIDKQMHEKQLIESLRNVSINLDLYYKI